MKAHLIDTHLVVPRSRSFTKVIVKYWGLTFQKNSRFRGIYDSQTQLIKLRIFTKNKAVLA